LHWLQLVSAFGTTTKVAALSSSSGERFNVLIKAASRSLPGPYLNHSVICRYIFIALVERLSSASDFDARLFSCAATSSEYEIREQYIEMEAENCIA